ncbi:MAG: NifB/NifX family molybdenum-iron cluster-binding protein [Desulfurococcales archaeon]|nr:NifB/NifX family molybdenum-iron cluster-binding protein [Desulfurococcales archaeon]
MSYGYGRGRGRGWGRRGWGRQRGWGVPQQPQQTPPPAGEVRVAVPVNNAEGMNSMVSQVFARSPYIALIDVKDGQVMSVNVLDNPAASVPQGAGLALAQWLISKNVRVVLAPNMGTNLAQALTQAGVFIYQVAPNIMLADALRSVGLIK